MDGRQQRVWLTGRDEIARAIGRSPRAISKLVATEELPAFKFYGSWTATVEDLTKWCRRMAHNHRPKRPR